MKVPVRWLRELVAVDWSAAEIARRMTMAGLEAEAITMIGETWDNVFVGYVEKVEKHPNADRLKLVTVSAGEHHLTVVTGAPNIAEQQKVPLALVGARLVDGHSDEFKMATLKANTIRGVRSEGMICSEKELSISDEHEGIMVLAEDAPVGMPLREYMGDEVIEFEITPNLVHAFSMIGIARELGAIAAAEPKLPALADLSSVPNDNTLASVHASDLCPRYVVTLIENVRVEPSPAWMQQHLQAAGVRPINNIVDVTNYVMLEWGQPLHAFDRTFLRGGRIVVRRAEPDEPIETLDHVKRTLNPDTLVIADTDRAVGLAGVMGGVNSEIRDDTTTVLLEAANFDMKNVRQTSRVQHLRTEASARFERGVDPNLAWIATQRAVTLIQEMLPDARVSNIHDVYPEPRVPFELTCPRSEINRLLGVDFSDEEVLDILGRLDFQPRIESRNGEATIVVQVPTWRSDVSLKADIVEEVARIAGYDKLPETLPVGGTVPVEIDPKRQLVSAVQDILSGAGLQEIMTYSMINDHDLESLAPGAELAPDRFGFFGKPALPLVRVTNPLRSDWELMRPTLVPSILKNAAENLKFSQRVNIFEVARVYQPRGIDELPDERQTVALLMAGSQQSAGLYSTERETDFFDAKGATETLLQRLGAADVTYAPIDHPSLHPGRSAEISAAGVPVGIIGEVHPVVAAQFGISDHGRIAIAEIDLVALLETGLTQLQARPVSRSQPIDQDFAVVVDEDVPAENVRQAIAGGAGFLLVGARLFDIYRGPAIAEGKKSLAYRVTFAAPDRQLREFEVEKLRTQIERQIKKQVHGSLRA
ncbi:MAG TPA: phenylalanine--tRNA ligase subunit beta [Nitrolancea sp.]